jgi:predicted glycoside hydrolase/deacetylase ChbG (UPF0249 family)
MRLIVNADDFGMSREANRGIVLAAKRRFVNSVSVCVTLAQDEGALADEATELGSIPLGLHVNLTEGRPLSKPGTLGTMVDGEGSFRPALESLGLEQELERDAILEEIRAQVAKFETCFGKAPAHMDCHQHFGYLSPTAFLALVECSKSRRIPLRSASPFVDPDRLEYFARRVRGRYGVSLPFEMASRCAELKKIRERMRPIERTEEALIDGHFPGGLLGSAVAVAERLGEAGTRSVEIVCHPRAVGGEKSRIEL